MQVEICENCEAEIGVGEQAFVYEGRILCGKCNAKLPEGADGLPSAKKKIDRTKVVFAAVLVAVILSIIGIAVFQRIRRGSVRYFLEKDMRHFFELAQETWRLMAQESQSNNDSYEEYTRSLERLCALYDRIVYERLLEPPLIHKLKVTDIMLKMGKVVSTLSTPKDIKEFDEYIGRDKTDPTFWKLVKLDTTIRNTRSMIELLDLIVTLRDKHVNKPILWLESNKPKDEQKNK